MTKQRTGKVTEIPYLSISQLKTHELNPLHWILTKVLGLKSPGSAATEFGGKFHEEVEEVLKSGAPLIKIKSGKYMSEVCEFVESWLSQDSLTFSIESLHNDIEHQFKEFSIAPDLPPFTGVIDVLVQNPLRIIDHKTVGVKRYALKQEGLKNDDQLILYAYYALTQIDPEAPEIVVQHNQWFKKAKRDKFAMIQDTLSREHVMKAIEGIRERARSLVSTYQTYCKEGLEAVTNDVSSCRYAFGGCPFLPICEGQMTPEEFLKAKESGPIDTNARAAEKLFASNSKKCYDKCKRENEEQNVELELPVRDGRREDILLLIKEADDIIINSGKAKNQFDHRKLVAQEVVRLAKDRQLQSVLLPLYLVIGSDPDMTPTLTALQKAGVELIHKIA
jgi:hypothetical protein